MSERKGDWMKTFTGRRFYPLDPRAEELAIEDIAHALSNICRFGGHARTFYSVAQHSFIVAGMVPHREHRLEALLHDAAEAYIGDMVRPLKYQDEMLDFRVAEERIYGAIVERFRPRIDGCKCVKWADNRALATEARDLMGVLPGEWSLGVDADPDIRIAAWPAEHAEAKFLERFHELMERPNA